MWERASRSRSREPPKQVARIWEKAERRARAASQAPEQVGPRRTTLAIYGAELVALDRNGRPCASFAPAGGTGDGVFIEFDAAAGSRYAIDAFLAGVSGVPISGNFDVTVRGPGTWPAQRLVPSPDGHLLHSFAATRAGRYTVIIERPPRGGRWHFYRIELLRIS